MVYYHRLADRQNTKRRRITCFSIKLPHNRKTSLDQSEAVWLCGSTGDYSTKSCELIRCFPENGSECSCTAHVIDGPNCRARRCEKVWLQGGWATFEINLAISTFTWMNNLSVVNWLGFDVLGYIKMQWLYKLPGPMNYERTIELHIPRRYYSIGTALKSYFSFSTWSSN